MPIPATSGQFRTKLEDMQIGDYIAFKAVGADGAAPVITEIGAMLATAQANEIPVSGSTTPNGYAYAIKTDSGICISDRIIQHSISWDVLNIAKLIQGKIHNHISLATANNQHTTGLYPGSQAIDGDITTFCHSATGGFPYIVSLTVDASSPSTAYSITPRIGYITLAPKTWTYEGSLNNIDWVVLDTQVNYTNWVDSKPSKFIFSTPISYPYCRIVVTDSIEGTTGNCAMAEIKLDSDPKLIRSLTGGNAYLSTDGKASLTDQNLGAWPSNNEWDKYIVGSTLGGKIIAGDDNVWHWSNCISWCQDTPVNGLARLDNRFGSISYKITRSYNMAGVTLSTPWFNESSSGMAVIGFRPVIQYLESNAKASNLFY